MYYQRSRVSISLLPREFIIQFFLYSVTVRLGEYNIDKNPDCYNGICADPVQDIDVARIYKHENYDDNTRKDDIALIKLSESAKFTHWVSPICLPNSKYFTNSFLGKKATFAGWGYTNIRGLVKPAILQTVKLFIVKDQDCNKEYDRILTAKQFCAHDKNHDTCEGDSGGPSVIVSRII